MLTCAGRTRRICRYYKLKLLRSSLSLGHSKPVLCGVEDVQEPLGEEFVLQLAGVLAVGHLLHHHLDVPQLARCQHKQKYKVEFWSNQK